MQQIKITLLFLFFLAVSSQNPGVKLAVTADAVKAFQTTLLPQLIAKIGNIQVDNISAGDLQVSNILISQINLPADSIRFGFNDGHLSVQTDNFGLNINMHIDYKVIFFSVNFDMSVSCSGSTIATDFGFGYGVDHVIFNMNNFQFQIRNLDLHFPSGIADAIIGTIAKIFRDQIQNLLSDKLSSALKGVIADAVNKIMASIPGYGPIPGSSIGVDYNPSQAPVIAASGSYFSVGLNGTFYNSDKGLNVPPVPLPGSLPDYDHATAGSTQVFISEYMINTLLYTFFQEGNMKIRVTNSMIPPSVPFKLNIDFLKQFIPGVAQHYDGSTEVAFDLIVNKAPLATITAQNIEGATDVIMTFFAVNGTNFTEMASLEGNVVAHANVTVANWTMKPYIESADFSNFKVVRSEVGDIDPDTFASVFNVVTGMVIDMVNLQAISITLPTVPYVNLETLSVLMLPGYLEVTANPTFGTLGSEKVHFGQEAQLYAEYYATNSNDDGEFIQIDFF